MLTEWAAPRKEVRPAERTTPGTVKRPARWMRVTARAPASRPPIDPIIVWLRTDLRLDDHEPLARATASGAPVLPVYCVDPLLFGSLPSGVRKTGAFRAHFLLQSLATLRDDLRTRGGDLVIRHGAPHVVLPQLVREAGASAVWYHEEAAPEEVASERRVLETLRANGVSTRAFWGHTVLHRSDLPWAVSDVPRVFTDFRRSVQHTVRVREPFAPPVRLTTPAVDPGSVPSLSDLSLSEPPADARVLFHPQGGEANAQARLEHYLFGTDRVRTYRDTRNGMLGVDDSSRLSPWLAMGCLSPRRVFSEVMRYEALRGGTPGTEWLIVELLWRDYFRFVTAGTGPALFRANGLRKRPLTWRSLREPAAARDFARWCTGATGYPLIDAAMRELSASGFMSNRGRQIVGSFLTKNLGIDWRAGAEWFESLLVDYDVASNWGNWAYVAGVGNDARGYRYFDIDRQAQQYDPQGDFVRHWISALRSLDGAAAHRPDLLLPSERERAGVRLDVDYPSPMVDLAASARAAEQRYSRGGVEPAPHRNPQARR